MVAAYPGTVRIWTTKVDLINIDYADDINTVQEEIYALQSTLGVNIQGAFVTTDARITDLEDNKAPWPHRHDILTDIDDLDADFATEYLNNTRHDSTGRHVFGVSAAFGNRVAASSVVANGASTGTKQGTSNTPAAADHRHEIGTATVGDDALSDSQKWWPGDLKASGRTTAPTGWVLCDGSAYSRTDPTYSSLFAAIGTAFGVGNGSTTFNVPDARSSTLIGAGQRPGLTNRARGSFLGEEQHVIDITEVPAHNHTVPTSTHEHLIRVFNSFYEAAGYGLTNSPDGFGDRVIVIGDNPGHNIQSDPGAPDTNTGPTGGNLGTGGFTVAHNNMQPSVAVNFFIKL